MKKVCFALLLCVLAMVVLVACADNCAGSSYDAAIKKMVADLIDNYSTAVTTPSNVPTTTDGNWDAAREFAGNTNRVRVCLSTNTDSKHVSPTDLQERPLQYQIIYADYNKSNPVIFNFIKNSLRTPSDSNFVISQVSKAANYYVDGSEIFAAFGKALSGKLINGIFTEEVIGPNGEIWNYVSTEDTLVQTEKTIKGAASGSSSKTSLKNALRVVAAEESQEAIKNTAYIYMSLCENADNTIIPYLIKRKGTGDKTKIEACHDALNDAFAYFRQVYDRAASLSATKADLFALELANAYSNQYSNLLVASASEMGIVMSASGKEILLGKAKVFDEISGLNLEQYVPKVLNIM